MAGSDKTITINVRALTGQLTTGMRGATQEVKKFGSETEDTLAQVETSTERISRLWRSAFEAFLGFEAVKALRDIAMGADDASEQLAAAAVTARNFGHNLNPAAMERWLQSFAKSAQGGGYAIDQMRSAVQQFASVGLDAAEIQRALADTASLAAAKNLDYAEAANIVRYALTGHVEMLTRYGIVSREAAKGIHTVEQAMEALETATKGAAEERAQRLAGAFGRLSTAASTLRDKIGDALIPFFDAVAKALTALADVVSSIPEPVLAAGAAFAAFATSAVAITLVLPAIWKGLQIGWAAFNLLLIPARLVGSYFIGPLIGAFASVITWLGGLRAALASGALAEWAFAAPVPSLVLAAAALVGAIALVVENLDTFKKAWKNSLDVMGTTFMEWVHTVGNGFKQLGAGIIELSGATSLGELKKGWKDFSKGLDVAMNTTWDPSKHGLGSAFKKDFSANLTWAEGAAKSAFDKIFGFMNAKLGNVKIPNEGFQGIIPGKEGSDKSGQQAENAFKNFDDAVKGWLAGFAAKVASAKATVDVATEKLSDFDVKHPADQPMAASDLAQRQKLVNDQLEAEQKLRTSLLANQRAEVVASSEFLKVASQIPAKLKNHDELVRQARDAAREHAKAAQDIYLAYLRAGTELDTIIAKEREAARTRLETNAQTQIDAAQQQFDARKQSSDLDVEAIQQAIAMAQMGAAPSISFTGAPQSESAKNFREQAAREVRSGGRGAPNVVEDKLKIQLAALALATAKDEEATKKHTVAILQEVYDKTKSKDDLDKLTAAQNALTSATLDVVKANDAYMAAQQKLTLDLSQKWDTLMQGLIQKVGAPGLSGAGTATSPLAFNPMAMLFSALEQTQAFADVMNTATQIVQTLTQAFEALRPIIDAIMMVVRAVVNVFIFLYNAVARILDLFGLQIQQLQYLTDAMSGLVPLISIVHEIPTLNELAAGRLNSPLSTTPQGSNTLGQSNGGQNTLMRVVEILTAIFLGIMVEKMLSGLTLGQALHQTGELVGLNIGQKMLLPPANLNNALGVTRNATLVTMSGTLIAMLAALQQQAAANIFSKAVGAVGGGLTPFAQGGSEGGPMGPMSRAAKATSDALSGATRALRAHAAALRDSVSALQQFTNAANSASRALIAVGVGANSSSALGLDTDRRMGMSGKNIDRVNLA